MVPGNPSWQLLHKNKPSRRLFSNIDLIVCLLTGTYIIGFNGQSKVGRLGVSILSPTRHLASLIKMLQSDGCEKLTTESSAVQELERGKNPKTQSQNIFQWRGNWDSACSKCPVFWSEISKIDFILKGPCVCLITGFIVSTWGSKPVGLLCSLNEPLFSSAPTLSPRERWRWIPSKMRLLAFAWNCFH